MTSDNPRYLYQFDKYTLDSSERTLKRDGKIIPLPLKPIEILIVLVERKGALVSKEDLMRLVWPECFVEEANLARHIYLLRQTLSEGPRGEDDKHYYIQTIPRRGYRFACEVAPVTELSDVALMGIAAIERGVAADNSSVSPPSSEYMEENDSDTTCEATAIRPRPWLRSLRLPWRRPLAATLLLTLLALLALFLFNMQPGMSEQGPETVITRLNGNRNVLLGSISPDGKYIVSIVEEKGRQSLWTRFIASGTENEITPPTTSSLGGLSFSSDGDFVYYNVMTRPGSSSTLYEVPIVGGPRRKIKEGLDSPASLSSDGRQIAFVREDQSSGRSRLIIASLNDKFERELIARRTPEYLDYPVWSPDGARIICTFNTSIGGFRSQLLEVNAADGSEKRIQTPSWRYIRRPIWLRNKGVIVTATEGFLANQAWLLPIGNAKLSPRRLTSGMRVCCGVSVTADNRDLVFTEENRYANVWIAPFAEPDQTVKITSGAGHYEDLTWTPDGRLLYATDGNGYWNIWCMEPNGGGRRQLTFDAHENRSPSMSPDGRYIFYTSIRDSTSSIWRMDADGSNPKQLTSGGNDFGPHCTSQNRWVIFTSYTNDSAYALRKISVEGGEPMRINGSDLRDGAASPDGKYVACLLTEGRSSPSVKPTKLAVISVNDGAIRTLGAIPSYRVNSGGGILRWTPDGRSVAYVSGGDEDSNIWVQPLSGGPPQQLTHFQGDQIFGFDFSPSGRLAVLRGSIKREIVRITHPILGPGVGS
jgi:Tol biopolymer transport system component/DNA-binding winged helix-turn-helix (wHTH) protein